MKLRAYLDSLTDAQFDAFAERCCTTPAYMRVHIKYGRKEPRKPLREALSRESGGAVSELEVLEHFGLLPNQEPSAA